MKDNLLDITKFFVTIIFVFFSSCSSVKTEKGYDIFTRVDPTTFRVTQREAAFPVAGHDGAVIDFVCLGDAANNELVTNAIDWINIYVTQTTGQKIAVRSEKSQHTAF